MSTLSPIESSGSQPLRIFVVENHPDTLESLQIYLEEMGHTVESAGTVADALAALPGANCDVLISDIGLPDGTGWDLLQRLQFRRPIYTIAMSGFGMNADHARSRAAGFRRHLLKPFPLTELDVLLEEAVRELPAVH